MSLRQTIAAVSDVHRLPAELDQMITGWTFIALGAREMPDSDHHQCEFYDRTTGLFCQQRATHLNPRPAMHTCTEHTQHMLGMNEEN